MPIYSSGTLMVEVFERLADQLVAADPSVIARLFKSGLAIKFECRDPAVQVTLDARQSPPKLDYGPSPIKPQITIGLAADTLHCILLGELGIRKAMGRGLLDLKGPVWKVISLGDLFAETQKVYPDVLRQNGLPTLCPAQLI